MKTMLSIVMMMQALALPPLGFSQEIHEVDQEMVGRTFGVTLQPGAILHPTMNVLQSSGDFELQPDECIAAIYYGNAEETVEVAHKGAIQDARTYSVRQQTLLLLRAVARPAYNVADVVVAAGETSAVPFGAGSRAWEEQEADQNRFQKALDKAMADGSVCSGIASAAAAKSAKIADRIPEESVRRAETLAEDTARNLSR